MSVEESRIALDNPLKQTDNNYVTSEELKLAMQ